MNTNGIDKGGHLQVRGHEIDTVDAIAYSTLKALTAIG